MICLVLAAGYATRLYPLTENFPKPLLEVKGKTILDWLLDDADGTGLMDRHIIISNHRYFGHFQEWASRKKLAAEVDVLDDGSVSNETRLGAVADIQLAIDALNLDDDLLVLAGDNLLDFSLSGFVAYSKKKKSSCIMRCLEPDVEKLRQAGVLELDDRERVTRMEEKPLEPFSNWFVPPFYYYRREDLPWIRKAIEDGCGTDAPGSLVAWLSRMIPVHAMEMPGNRYDIGDVESLRAAREEFPGIILS